MLTGDALLAKVKELRMQPEMTVPTPDCNSTPVSQDELVRLKEQALSLLDKAEDPSWDINDFSIVRKALEALHGKHTHQGC